MKHLKLFENQIKRYWIINDPGDSLYDDVTYLFDNEKDLLNFTLNRVYNIIKDNYVGDNDIEELFSNLDNCNDAETLLEVVSDAVSEDLLGDFNRVPRFEATSLDENIKIQEWIELRRSAKKYNL